MTKNTLWLTLGLIVSMFLAASANAESTIANGPYYATPSWDQKLPSATRFVTLANWGNQAVLDRETGLVWAASPINASSLFINAVEECIGGSTGDRGGWRLPTIMELMRVLNSGGSQVIADSPFAFLTSGDFFIWSSTPRTLSEDDVPGKTRVVDEIYVASIFGGKARWSSSSRTVSSSITSPKTWCVQSPASGL
jgi:hypothetical protein